MQIKNINIGAIGVETLPEVVDFGRIDVVIDDGI